MMELISREMAIDHIRVLGGEDRERLIGILNNKDILPTIESRPKGKWKQGFSHKYVCSRCEQGTDIESDYCAWCGADMRGEE